jgi:hypothetical protein
MPALLLLILSGCRTEYSTFSNALSLVVEVQDQDPVAGEDLAYIAYMGGTDTPIEVTGLALSSDLEALLDYDEERLTPLVAGEHTLVGSVTYKGEIYVATVPLDVAAGPPAIVDLALEDLQIGAGEDLGYSVYAWDAYGNLTDEGDRTVSVDSSAVSIESDVFTSTTPGTYVATATAGQASDSEDFRVVAGPAEQLLLSLDRPGYELNQTALATVEVVDAYGNPVDRGFDLWVEPAGAQIDYNGVTWLQEGNFTVFASTLDGVLSDSVGPLLIDSTGPELEILVPERGYETTDIGLYVSGTAYDEWSGVSGVYVNGDAATMNGDGTWEVWQDLDFGTTILETDAVDGDGNGSNDLRATLSGEYTPYGNGVDSGIQARISESGFDALESLAGDFINTDLIASSIPSPVFSDSSETCFGWFGCITWYSVSFYLTNPSVGSTELDIDPTSGGYLDTEAKINSIFMNWSASGKVIGISYSGSGYIQADWIKLNMDMTPYVSSGELGVTVANAAASTQNFDFDLDGWLYDVVDFFGIDVDGLIEGYLVDALADMAEDTIPDLFADAVQDLEIGFTFPIEANTYDLDAIPSAVSVDDTGMTLGLETYFTAGTVVTPHYSPGSLTYPYSTPSYSTTTDDLTLGLNQDFINQALHGLWSGGLLEMQMESEELGLDLSDLSDFLPELTDLSIATSAYLPPVVLPGTGGSLLDMQIGDLEVSIYNGAIDEANLFMRVYVQVNAGLDLSASADNTLSAGLGDINVRFDLVYPNEGGQYATDTEALLEALVPMLLPSLTDALGEIPIPDLAGFGLSGVTVGLEGAEDGVVVLGGDLVTR